MLSSARGEDVASMQRSGGVTSPAKRSLFVLLIVIAICVTFLLAFETVKMSTFAAVLHSMFKLLNKDDNVGRTDPGEILADNAHL
jgi:hypothetical protein